MKYDHNSDKANGISVDVFIIFFFFDFEKVALNYL